MFAKNRWGKKTLAFVEKGPDFQVGLCVCVCV